LRSATQPTSQGLRWAPPPAWPHGGGCGAGCCAPAPAAAHVAHADRAAHAAAAAAAAGGCGGYGGCGGGGDGRCGARLQILQREIIHWFFFIKNEVKVTRV